MGIKAVGTITEHLNDRKRVEVDVGKAEPVQEWSFYTIVELSGVWSRATG